jgi:hypothetical protein
MTTTTATVTPAAAVASPTPTTLAAVNVTQLKNIDLFQVFVGQIDKLNELFRELFLCCLTVTVVRFHELFSFPSVEIWNSFHKW